jgi:hypothetical protein
VVGVDNQIKTHQIGKSAIAAESEHVGVVGRVIELWVVVDLLSIVVDVSVDARGNDVDLGDDIHGIFVGGIPVLVLGHTSGVSVSEHAFGLEG